MASSSLTVCVVLGRAGVAGGQLHKNIHEHLTLEVGSLKTYDL
jgi:hypothetical protein